MDESDEPDQALEEIEAGAAEVCAELIELQRLALAASGFPPGKELPADFSLNWRPGMSGEELAGQLMDEARRAASDLSALHPGHVYCYRCHSANCEHSQPKSAGEVFAGYQNTGEPKWQEFFNFLLALGDDRLDLIFAEPPQLLAWVAGRKQLTAQQFVSGGRNSMTYRILGQVVAGYFQVRGWRCALTVQVVENPARELHVQLIAPEPVREALADTPPDEPSNFARIYDALQEFQHRIRALGAEWKNAKGQAERRKRLDRIFIQLRRVSNSIERKGRQSHRRTQHAQRRSNDQRPVHKAFDDLAAAPEQNFYRDRDRQSIVVIGRKSRAHVFSPEGRHVTSLLMPADKLERRLRRKRYIPLSPEEARDFLAILSLQ